MVAILTMRIALHTPVISPHQLPLAREVARLVGVDNYRYIYTQELTASRKQLGWNTGEDADLTCLAATTPEAQEWLANADVLITSFRDCDLIEARCKKGLQTFYCNERWFRPFKSVDCALLRTVANVIGRVRMLVPNYRRRVHRLVRLCYAYSTFRLLPIGVHAYNDYAWAGVPKDKMTLWGYFVAPSDQASRPHVNNHRIDKTQNKTLSVLWVGRPLALKRVKDIEAACTRLQREGVDVTLTIKTGVPINEVRALMRAHEVYVFSSNAYEGWGAVVSEALEEGMNVVGTYESGAPATLLPESHLYHAGDVKALTARLRSVAKGELDLPEETRRNFEANWTAKGAAQRLMALVQV